MRTTCHTDDYERAHGRAPRGEGTWAFTALAYAPARGATALFNNEYRTYRGTYAAAKKRAAEEAKAEARTIGGANEVILTVLS